MGRDQEIGLPEGFGRALAAQEGFERRKTARPGFGHVEMGIGAENADVIGQRDHAVREIGVHVEADDDRQVQAVTVADQRQKRAFAIVMALGDHRAVEVEIDRVRAFDAVEDVGRDGFERVVGDGARGFGGTPEDWLEVMARREGALGKARDGQVHALGSGDDIGPAQKARPAIRHLELGQAGEALGEGVGFMLEACDGNAGHLGVVPWNAVGPGAQEDALAALKCTQAALNEPFAIDHPDI